MKSSRREIFVPCKFFLVSLSTKISGQVEGLWCISVPVRDHRGNPENIEKRGQSEIPLVETRCAADVHSRPLRARGRAVRDARPNTRGCRNGEAIRGDVAARIAPNSSRERNDETERKQRGLHHLHRHESHPYVLRRHGPESSQVEVGIRSDRSRGDVRDQRIEFVLQHGRDPRKGRIYHSSC